MSVLRAIALACSVCIPAVLVAAELGAAADRTASPAMASSASPGATQIAQADDADDAAEAEESGAEEVVFTEDFLNDPAHIAGGKELWDGTCRGCHGAQAYPGKAPKLKPKRYEPEFVFDRVTNGYKKMPAWKDVFSKEERMDVVAYILSDNFSP